MKSPGSHVAGKARMRDLIRRRGRSHGPPVVRKTGRPPLEPTPCRLCGAVYRRKTWRRSARRSSRAWAAAVRPGVCPACRGPARGGRHGQLLLHGAASVAEREIRRRIANVAARAGFTQPERRVISVRVEGEDLEVLTTAEELAHRIVHELQKAFGGRAAYAWSDRDGGLRAVWDTPARTRERRS